jgi:hypothetical protein
MSEFKRVDNLNEHVLSKRVTEILTAELLSKTGRDDFFVVFYPCAIKKNAQRSFTARAVHFGAIMFQCSRDASENLFSGLGRKQWGLDDRF